MTTKKNGSELSRRGFIQTSVAAAGMSMLGTATASASTTAQGKTNPITISKVDSNFEREPLLRPFGFKGSYMSEIWQAVSFMQSSKGTSKVGLGTQNVLWSDAKVFGDHSESGGNALMYALTERALQITKGMSFVTPVHLLDDILDEVYNYGKRITGNPNLRKTFALNALVGVDNAAWLLYAEENGITTFDDMIPAAYRPALSNHSKQVASIPSIAYTIPINEITEAVDEGFFFLKIKLGQPGSEDEMVEKDMARVEAIHKAIGHRHVEHTKDGKIPYYFDINGRYQKKESLQKLLDHAQKIGAFDQIAVVEEPFPEEADYHVGDFGVSIAADESAHTDADAIERIEMGYSSIALKAIAKTLSMTMKIAQVAHDRGIPTFCADLTVNPILQDWNKAIASRVAPFPGLGMGLQEANGHQNYTNWQTMQSYHPHNGASWTKSVDGVFELKQEFYDKSGGIFTPSPHYEEMFKHHRR